MQDERFHILDVAAKVVSDLHDQAYALDTDPSDRTRGDRARRSQCTM
jgi:hypothetical protein